MNGPLEDLQAALDAENVAAFLITGHSQGNPHAMAAASRFGYRVTGIGLNAPILPNELTEKIGAWLAQYYQKKEPMLISKLTIFGNNHMTFNCCHFRKTENRMVKALLDDQNKQ